MTHLVGEIGWKLKSIRLAIVAVTGPRTISHLFFAFARILYALAHFLPIRFLVLTAALVHIPIQAVICSIGIATLGSGWADFELLFRKAQDSNEVLQALAPAIPVASVMLALHRLMLEGAMPTAVWP